MTFDMLVEISSKENPSYKRLKKIATDKEGFVFIEGRKLLTEAFNSGLKVKEIFVDRNNYNNIPDKLKNNNDCQLIYMNNSLIASAYTTESIPHEEDLLIALAQKPEWNCEDILKTARDVVLLERIQDPGNLGSVIRSSVGFNAGGIILLSDSVYPFNTKVIRSSTGAVFNMPIISLDNFNHFYMLAKKKNYNFISTSPSNGNEPDKITKKSPNVFMFGNEGKGLTDELFQAADQTIRIPHLSKIKSLNLSVAVSVILWEFYKK